MSRLNVEIRPAIYKRFMDQCEEDGRSVSDVVRMLMLDFVERRVREKHKLARLDDDKEKEYEGRAVEGG